MLSVKPLNTAYPSRKGPPVKGGQQQRLTLPRALVMEPKLPLLDERLSNLDGPFRTPIGRSIHIRLTRDASLFPKPRRRGRPPKIETTDDSN